MGKRLYQIWHDMRQRCSNPRHKNYDRYGGRGIVVCAEWDKSFDNFRKWAMASGYSESLTIDRYPNNDGNYEPGNCRWATRTQQSQNRHMPPCRRGRWGSGKFIGVTWSKRYARWRARIKYMGKQIDLGTFSSVLAAALCYDAKASELYGDSALLNFPERRGMPLPEYVKLPGSTSRRSRFAVGCTLTKRGKWQAQICVAGQQKYLGIFCTREEASEAYRKALAELTS